MKSARELADRLRAYQPPNSELGQHFLIDDAMLERMVAIAEVNKDDHILEINGRAHRGPEIERAYHTAKDAGFPQVNIDLIAGMLEETEDNWKRCVDRAIELDPESIYTA